MLPYDETPALAARARLAARAVLGLVLEEERSARFVYEYSTAYFRQGIEGEAERKAELLSAIARESLLLVAARIELSLPRAVASSFSRVSEPEAVAVFRHAFLTFLGGSLAWDADERESFRRDLAMYLRLAAREGRVMARRPGAPPLAGAFVDRCAFLVDPSMMTQAREAAARYQVQLESCADQALQAAFRGLHAKTAPPVSLPRPKPEPKRQQTPRPKAEEKAKRRPKPKRKPKAKPKPKRKPKLKLKPKAPARPAVKARPKRKKTPPRRKPTRRAKPAPRRARPEHRPTRKRPKK
ncbi:MAG TPA: hypothetical protein VNJ12_08460 [Candidatus Dormibacteraeota bacterium]|nr:hypothetical protein [Candidatus Dormibacteraeota bacterium]